jgi:diguanylate cyclase (GGDEF)-like protein
MENQLHTKPAAKLSLVGSHQQAAMAAMSQAPNIYEDAEDIIAKLPAVLQTTIDLETVIGLFHQQISKVIAYDSLHFQHQGAQCSIDTAARSHHSCNYRLEMNAMWLGEFTLTRGKKFSDEDTRLVEDLLCKLVYPLRNCLLYKQAQTAALQDQLTGLNNRGAFDASIKREIDLSLRQRTPLSLIVLDIDHFKNINDSYGHSSGDRALKLLADTVKFTMRQSDIAFRYGGEEFTLLLSNTDIEDASLVAERIRDAVSKLVCSDGQRDFGFTVSLGVAQLKQGEDGYSLFDRADHALYQGKKAGRNQTKLAE